MALSKLATNGLVSRCVFQLAPLSTSVTYHQQDQKENVKPFSEMPGDSGWPIIGAVELLTKLGDGKVGKKSFFHQAQAKYGPIARFKAPGLDNKWLVFATGPESVEAMFRAEGKYPSRNSLLENLVPDMHKSNNWPSPLLFAGGEDWKRIRSAVSQQVIPRRVANLTPILCDITDDLYVYLEDVIANNNGHIDDLTPVITKWAFQNTAYFVFGENMNMYDTSNAQSQAFITAGLSFFESLQAIIMNPLPIYKYYHTKSYKKFIKATKNMREQGKQIMERKVVALSEDIARGTVDETRAVGILEQWLIEGKLEPEDALTQACDFLSAGLDTTKNTVTLMLYELAKQPALQDQMCDEIKAVLGDKVNPSWEDLQNIPLIRYCLKETLRMYPPIEMNLREIGEDAVLNGYHVPAGTAVLISQDLTTRNEKYFDQPDKFLPERWSKNQEDSIHPFASLPFGFGPRGCYGRRLAELEIFILLTKLIPRFTLSTDKDSIALFQSLALKPNESVTVTVKNR